MYRTVVSNFVQMDSVRKDSEKCKLNPEHEWDLIGRGGFAHVYSALFNDRPVAVKKISLLPNETEKLENFRKEAYLLQSLSHENVVTFVEYLERRGRTEGFLITELVVGGALKRFCTGTEKGRLTRLDKFTVGYKILCGLEYLHQNNVVHKDIKPANILISNDYSVVKLSDFGLSEIKIASTAYSTKGAGTCMYNPPELYTVGGRRGLRHAKSSDIYSMGATLCELVTEQHFWSIERIERDEIRSQLKAQRLQLLNKGFTDIVPDCWKYVDKTIQDIVQPAIDVNYHRRPSATTLKLQFYNLLIYGGKYIRRKLTEEQFQFLSESECVNFIKNELTKLNWPPCWIQLNNDRSMTIVCSGEETCTKIGEFVLIQIETWWSQVVTRSSGQIKNVNDTGVQNSELTVPPDGPCSHNAISRFDEIHENDIAVQSTIGWGSFGKVMKGKLLDNNSADGKSMIRPTNNILLPPPPPVDAMNNRGVEKPSLNFLTTFPDDVQEEANGYFQQIYTQPPQPCMTIEQFLDILKRFRDSGIKKERDLFACMIKNLFEEFSFFAQYPDKELHTTAMLFGGVVRENLVLDMPLMFALRVVMESLSNESSTKLFTFGQVALNEFKMRLKEFPRYCERLLTIPRLQQLLKPPLYEYISCGAEGKFPSISFLMANGLSLK